jgi:mono/diheme cytochrome c family protein
MGMKTLILIALAGGLFSCTQNGSEVTGAGASSRNPAPPAVAQGEVLYSQFCSRCHGEKGSGTDKGPPFLSSIYEPNHHGDESFVLAARNGSRAHHWSFGDMPPIPGVKEEDVRKITEYVRWLQKEAHIY